MPPLILFGAFDRHNFGDLLFPHIVSALLPQRRKVFAGLARRDLRAAGGHQVEAIGTLARSWGSQRADLIHVGGELLGCNLYQAAVMLQTPTDAHAAIRHYDGDPAAARRWAQQQTGLRQDCAYLADKHWFQHPGRFIYNGIGGADFDQQPGAMRDEIRLRLQQADYLGVRDRQTQQALAAAGIESGLQPDCAVLLPQLFGHWAGSRPPTGLHGDYLALQFAAGFGDDATLASLAAQLAPFAAAYRLKLVLFRAGSAPWHDDLDVYRRLQARLPATPTLLFESTDIRDIATLLRHCRLCCSSSLHARIVANSFGRPAVCLDDGASPKLSAYLASHPTADPATPATPATLADMLAQALATPAAALQQAARHNAASCLQAMRQWLGCLEARRS